MSVLAVGFAVSLVCFAESAVGEVLSAGFALSVGFAVSAGFGLSAGLALSAGFVLSAGGFGASVWTFTLSAGGFGFSEAGGVAGVEGFEVEAAGFVESPPQAERKQRVTHTGSAVRCMRRRLSPEGAGAQPRACEGGRRETAERTSRANEGARSRQQPPGLPAPRFSLD
jgi:hypothetical protein